MILRELLEMAEEGPIFGQVAKNSVTLSYGDIVTAGFLEFVDKERNRNEFRNIYKAKKPFRIRTLQGEKRIKADEIVKQYLEFN